MSEEMHHKLEVLLKALALIYWKYGTENRDAHTMPVNHLKLAIREIHTLLDSEVVEVDCEDCKGWGHKFLEAGIPNKTEICPTCKGTKKQTLGVWEKCGFATKNLIECVNVCEVEGQNWPSCKGRILRPLTWGELPKAILEKWKVVRICKST